MATSADSPEYARQRRKWALWRELLPGIEEFLVVTLVQEKLTPQAEQRRQYFAERLDILKLPPSLPPRAGKRLSVELLEESEETCGIPVDEIPELSGLIPELTGSKPELTAAEKDFAAEQREISRNLLASVSSEKDIIEDIEETDSEKGVKVYDDIDPSASAKAEEGDDEDEDDINAVYEIPIARQQQQQQQPPQQPTSEDSLSQPADVSSLATAGSVDDINDDVLDTPSPGWQPPPLPPRTKKKESEGADSPASLTSLDTKPPDLPFRPPLPRRKELYARSERSDKSEKSEKSDVSDGDSTSYESFDENEHDTELMSKLNIKLPNRPKKKKSSKLLSSKGRSSSTWEINVPFKKLDSVVISGEMQHKGKLSWNRRLVAISNGCVALYKPEKDGRPVLVIPLSGFQAGIGEPLGRKGFEMKLTHNNGEAYTFAVDFKEWANLWCEKINNISQGLPVTNYPQHLVRTFSSGGGGGDSSTYGSKRDAEGNLSNSNSNLSVSSDGVESDDSSKPRMRANKVMRMGSFAYRATQFFENLGKKSTSNSKRKTNSLSSPTEGDFSLRDGIQEESSISSSSIGLPAVSPSSETTSPVFEDSFRHSLSSPSSSDPPPLPSTPPPPIPVNVKHQGYLNIFSSFNKRRWGQRWCMVRENMFECYRTQHSKPCELNFLLRKCVVRQALAETSSPLALMLLEDNKEKITVEPPSKEDLRQWLRVLMAETATSDVPEGLEEFFVEGDERPDDLLEAEYTDIVGASILTSWEVGSVPILPSQDKAAADTEKDVATATTSSTDDVSADAKTKGTCDAEVADKYLYTEVVKRPSTSSLDMLGEEREEEEEAEGGEREGEQHPGFTDNLAVYKSNKNTTDSGFYSVKEVNSDSESGSEVKTDNGSPAQESCSSSAAQEGTTLPECNNNPATRISDCAASSNGGKQVIEEEEEESALEKTMTSDDFKDGLSERGSDVVSAVSVESQCDVRAVSDSSVVQNGVKGVVKDQDNGDVSVTSETHVPTKPVVDTQTANGDDTQQPDKAKKKKKKSKNKKNKQKPSEQENAPTENHVNDTVTDTTSKPKSHKSKQDSSRSDVPAIPATNSSNVHAVSTDMSSSSTRKNSVPSGKELDVSEATTAATTAAEAAATASGNIGGDEVSQGPEDNETITDLKDRIGRLREKLVQIKRKRIAVRDKRVRAFSAEERAVCDKEYLALESECKETTSLIQRLEDDLKTVTAPDDTRL
ncbi:serine-rich adhesin for platelets-like isoform X5 [Littorina saxatilis]|uniref:serine-rich adhesin for platelets-like isoform X5 n=1 Tax=Littorina saxatilis TaxID=31220 RepID=UPI0038B65DF1